MTAVTRSLRPKKSRATPMRAPRSASASSACVKSIACVAACAVVPSSGSAPASTVSSAAASATDLHIGPAVSCDAAIGTMPARLTRPTVGLIPTNPQTDAGSTIEPSVSVPTANGARPLATAAAEPELEPLALRSSACGFNVRPPRPLQPLTLRDARKLAHSLRLVLPRITTPAFRSRRTMPASRVADTSASANEPALVRMRSAVAMLSLSSTGMPCSGPRTVPAARSASRAAAIASASGFASSTELMHGPARSMLAMRSRHC